MSLLVAIWILKGMMPVIYRRQAGKRCRREIRRLLQPVCRPRLRRQSPRLHQPLLQLVFRLHLQRQAPQLHRLFPQPEPRQYQMPLQHRVDLLLLRLRQAQPRHRRQALRLHQRPRQPELLRCQMPLQRRAELLQLPQRQARRPRRPELLRYQMPLQCRAERLQLPQHLAQPPRRHRARLELPQHQAILIHRPQPTLLGLRWTSFRCRATTSCCLPTHALRIRNQRADLCDSPRTVLPTRVSWIF
mmetsp:Transcript_34867/g.51839  ORF Transcript_34867/g.51839 Transcript_34867/m.51839 type:complete len:245 (-) Transcript_34867:1046-1780(-)